MKFVAYYRVSTDKQGKSGLGLESQQSAVEQAETATCCRFFHAGFVMMRALPYMRTTNDASLLERIAREQTDSVIQAAFWAMTAEYAVQAVGGEAMATA